jgi:hypothetical protein
VSHPLVIALLAELEAIDAEIAQYRALPHAPEKAVRHAIEEAQRRRDVLARITKHVPGLGHALVSLPTTDPVLADFLDHVGCGEAASTLRLAAPE